MSKSNFDEFKEKKIHRVKIKESRGGANRSKFLEEYEEDQLEELKYEEYIKEIEENDTINNLSDEQMKPL